MEDMRQNVGNGNGTLAGESGINAAEKLEQGKEFAMNLMDRLETIIRERPATTLLVALGAGFILGRIVRR